MMLSKELAVLVHFNQAAEQPLRTQGVIKLNSKLAVGVYPVSGPKQINETVENIDAQWFLLVSEHEDVASDVLEQVQAVRDQSAETRLFFLQDEVNAALVHKPLTPFAEQLCSLSPLGLLFEKRFVQGLGGFTEKYTHAFDMDLFLRSIKLPSPPLAAIPKNSFAAIHRQVPACVLGADRAMQATDLAAGVSGKASGYWFASLAQRVEKQMAQLPENDIERVKLQVYLAGVACRVAHQVVQGDQSVFAPYIKRSVYDGSTGPRDMSVAVDEAVQAFFDKPAQALVLPEALHCYALGQTPQCAQLLKQLGLKRVTGPFDWISVNPAALLHMLQDNFNEFLNPMHCKPQTSGSGALLRAVEHGFYQEHYGVAQMFSFHNLNRATDLEQYKQAVEVMRNALNWDAPTLSVYITSDPMPVDTFNQLLEQLQSCGPQNRLLLVRVQHQADRDQQESGEGVGIEPMAHPNGLLATLPVFSQSDGTVFADAIDNVRLARLLHGIVLGWFGKPA